MTLPQKTPLVSRRLRSKMGIGVTKEVGRFVGRDVQHWGIHV